LADEPRRLRERIDRLLGPRLGHTPSNWPRRVQKLVERLAETERRDAVELLNDLAANGASQKLDALVDAATIGHTAFFRHPEQFSELERVLPALAARRRRPLRIWCAGCSTGEEAYSLALTAERTRVASEILATDVNPIAVATARRGHYSATRTGLLPGPPGALTWAAPAALRARIRFEVASIADPSPALDFGAVDLVFCRNVLIYFPRERVPELLENLARLLLPGGALIVSPVDAVLPVPPSFERSGKPGWLKLLPHRVSDRVPPSGERPPPSRAPALTRASAPSPFDQAALLLGSGRGQEAEALLTTLLDRNPDFGAGWFLLGEALCQRGELAQARAAFLRASRSTPNDEGGIDGEALRAAAARRARTG
jgi:chemotaxis protein methyltransferase CheR